MSSDPVTGGVGAPRDETRPGLADALAAVKGTNEGSTWLVRRTVEAAYPIIAAAVRADERAKVLREVERITEFHAMIQCPHGPKCDDPMCLGRREVASMFRALTTSGSGS